MSGGAGERVGAGLDSVLLCADGSRAAVLTGRTHDLRPGGLSLDLSAPCPSFVAPGDTVVVAVRWDDDHRHLARVVGVDAGRRHLRMTLVKPACGPDPRWVEAVTAIS